MGRTAEGIPDEAPARERKPWMVAGPALALAWTAATGCERLDATMGRCTSSDVVEGRIALHRCRIPELTLAHECGPGCRQLSRVGTAPDTTAQYCLTRRAAYWTSGGYLVRVDLATGHGESLLGPWRAAPPVSPTGVSCHGDEVLFAATVRAPGRTDLLAQFHEGDAAARVVWSDVAPRRDALPPTLPVLWDRGIAWSWEFSVPGLWALERGNTEARPLRMDVRPAGPAVSDGEELIFQAGSKIERWSAGASAPEAIAPGNTHQWAPAAAAGRVAWVDQRDDPAGTLTAPRNPQIYLYDQATRSHTRVTRGGAAYRAAPFLSRTWLVWVDTRNDPDPDRGREAAYTRAEVFGYHLPTGREQVLVAGTIAHAPRLANGKLYYTSPSDGTHLDIFEQDLPSP